METYPILSQPSVEVVKPEPPRPPTGVVSGGDPTPAQRQKKPKSGFKTFKQFLAEEEAKKQQQKEQIVLRCSDQLKNDLHEEARRTKSRVSKIVRLACAEYLWKYRDGRGGVGNHKASS